MQTTKDELQRRQNLAKKQELNKSGEQISLRNEKG